MMIDVEKAFETIWDALDCWKEDCVSDDEEAQDDVNNAMAQLRNALHAPEEVYDSLSLLRDVIKSSDAGDHGSLMNAISTAKQHLNNIDVMNPPETEEI